MWTQYCILHDAHVSLYHGRFRNNNELLLLLLLLSHGHSKSHRAMRSCGYHPPRRIYGRRVTAPRNCSAHNALVRIYSVYTGVYTYILGTRAGTVWRPWFLFHPLTPTQASCGPWKLFRLSPVGLCVFTAVHRGRYLPISYATRPRTRYNKYYTVFAPVVVARLSPPRPRVHRSLVMLYRHTFY